MKLKVYYILMPTQELTAAAELAGETDLCNVSVWSTYETDRGGVEISKEELASSFWEDFKAQLIYENESASQKSFRVRCLELGFYKCWSLYQTTLGGDAGEVLDAGNEAKKFLTHSGLN